MPEQKALKETEKCMLQCENRKCANALIYIAHKLNILRNIAQLKIKATPNSKAHTSIQLMRRAKSTPELMLAP